MAGFFKKLADRFKPDLMERLKQSAAAKKKLRERTVDVPHVQQPSLPRGQLIRPDVEIRTFDTEATRLTNESLDAGTGGEVIWNRWYTTSNNITSCTTYNDPWSQWHNCDPGTTGVTDTNTIWRIWAANSGTVTTNQVTIHSNDARWAGWVEEADQRTRFRKESAAQKRLREEEEAKYRAQREAENARYAEEQRAAENRRKAADERAMGLLVMMLNSEQQSDLKNHKHFYVNAPSGRLYRIDQGTHGNLKVVDRQTRKIIERLCIQPSGVPAGDAMLMQKLLIETGEVALRKHANITMDATGEVIRGDSSPLTGDKLAQIIPLRKAA